MIRHDLRWTLDALDRQHHRTLGDRLWDLWAVLDRQLALWLVVGALAFWCGYWLW